MENVQQMDSASCESDEGHDLDDDDELSDDDNEDDSLDSGEEHEMISGCTSSNGAQLINLLLTVAVANSWAQSMTLEEAEAYVHQRDEEYLSTIRQEEAASRATIARHGHDVSIYKGSGHST